MDVTNTKFKLTTRSGNTQEINFDLRMYDEANEMGITLTQLLNQRYAHLTDTGRYGSVMGQFMEQSGMFLASDNGTGVRAPSMKQIMRDGIELSAITRNDGADRNTPNGRILFPEIIMRTMEESLRRSDDFFLNAWNMMVAQTVTVNGEKYDQPFINVTAPEESESQQISQLAEPASMVSITTSNITRQVPTHSIGLMISDQALQATTLDLVNLVMTAQARGELVRMVKRHLKGILNGDVDLGEQPLVAQKFKDFDPSLTGNSISHRAWVKYLWSKHEYSSINMAVCDIDTAMNLEDRSGKPGSNNFDPVGSNFAVNFSTNLAVPSPLIVPLDSDIVGGTNVIVGMDTRYAIRRVINVSANYNGIQDFVLRRAKAFRVDYGEMAHKLYPEAFSKVTATM